MTTSHRIPGEMRVPQWAVDTRSLVAQDIISGALAAKDLTGATIHFWVRDADGTPVLAKTSGDSAEIEVTDASAGEYDVKFVRADTAPLTPGDVYWFDCWAEYSGPTVQAPLLDRGRFYVDESVVDIDNGPVVPAGFAAPQSQQERSFKHTMVADASSFVVTIPGTGMYDATYCAIGMISTIPAGGSAALIWCPEQDTARTSTTFTVEASGTLLAGTIIDFIVRDAS